MYSVIKSHIIQFGLNQLLGLAQLVEVHQVQEILLHPGLVRGVVVAEVLDLDPPLSDSCNSYTYS